MFLRTAKGKAPKSEATPENEQLTTGGIPLKIEAVSKTFPGRVGLVEALRPVNVDIAAGEFVCFVGPSGCGKSTLLSMIAGLESPSSGTVWADGQQVRGPETRSVLLFQEAALFPWLDVQHNVEFGLRQLGLSTPERASLARSFIELVNLKGFEKSYAHQLSGGMRQRAAIARALAINPAVLLMDEPFGALDALTRDQLHAELELIWASTRKTVVFVTHNVAEAVALADRVLLFSPRPGQIVQEFRIDLPRPRSLEDLEVMAHAATITSLLRGTMGESASEKVYNTSH